MRAALVELGLARDAIHSELFGALAAINPGITDTDRPSPHPPAGPPGTGPLVTFGRSGLTVPWDDDVSLLDLADRCDVPTRWSCRSGVCHTCVTTLLSGGVRYAPDPLEAAADGSVLICCAQPVSDVALDM
jgi:ferredoxin